MNFSKVSGIKYGHRINVSPDANKLVKKLLSVSFHSLENGKDSRTNKQSAPDGLEITLVTYMAPVLLGAAMCVQIRYLG